MLHLIYLSILLGFVGAIAFHAVTYYRVSSGTRWERILATSRDSATWVWAKVLLVAGLLIEAMAQAAMFFQMPDVDSFIRTKVPVEWLGWVLLGIAAMTFASRARSLLRGD